MRPGPSPAANNLPIDVDAMRRDGDPHKIIVEYWRKSETIEDRSDPIGRDVEAGEGGQRSHRELHPLRLPPPWVDIDATPADFTTAKLGDQRRRSITGNCRHLRIRTALEAVGGLGVHAEAARGPPH